MSEVGGLGKYDDSDNGSRQREQCNQWSIPQMRFESSAMTEPGCIADLADCVLEH